MATVALALVNEIPKYFQAVKQKLEPTETKKKQYCQSSNSTNKVSVKISVSFLASIEVVLMSLLQTRASRTEQRTINETLFDVSFRVSDV